MVRTKASPIVIADILAASGAGVWFIVSEKQEAQERREKFFGAAKEFLASGGQKMKPEW